MSKRQIIMSIVVVIAAVAMVLIASNLETEEAAEPIAPEQPNRLNVTTTILPLHLVAKEIAGDVANVENLIPLDIPPYQTEPSAEDSKKLADIDLLIVSDTELDAWAEDIITAANFNQGSVVHAGKKLERIPSLPLINPDRTGEPASQQGGRPFAPTVETELAAYYWLDASRMILVAETIRDAMIEKDPARHRQYSMNAASFLEQLSMIDRDVRERSKGFKNKVIVGMYPYLTYFIESYDMEWLGALIASPEETLEQNHLNQLTRQMQRSGITAVFVPPQPPSWVARWAQDTGVSFFIFDPIEYTTSTDVTYNDSMRRNIWALSEGLKYEPPGI